MIGRLPPPRLHAWLLLWAGVVVLAAWARWPSPWWLLAAAAAALLPLRRASPAPFGVRAGAALLLLSTVAGLGAHLQILRLSSEGIEARRDRREETVGRELDRRLDRLLERGISLARGLAALPLPDEARPSTEAVLGRARASGVAALAIYGPGGRLLAWDGMHRGPVPPEVTTGEHALAYGERPLFGYLYFTAPRTGGGTAMVAVLLRADLPPGLDAGSADFASRFGGATGARIRITGPERASGPAVWDYGWEDETLFSVVLERETEAWILRSAFLPWVRAAVLGALLAWIALALGGRAMPGHRAAAAVSLVGLAGLLPLGPLLGGAELFSPADYLLPGVEATLGRVLAVVAAGLVAAGIVVLPRGRLPAWGSAAGIAVLFPAAGWVLAGGASRSLLAGAERGWALATLAAALGLVLVAALLLGGARSRRGAPLRPPVLAVALLLSVAFAALVSASVRVGAGLPFWALAAWGLPAWLLVEGTGTSPRRWRSLLLHAGAVVLGVSAAVPLLWSERVEARMAVGEEELRRLGVRADPYLDFLLRRMGERLRALRAEGADAVEALYAAWVESGMAREGYPLWLTLWTEGGIPAEELRIGVTDPRPSVADDFLDEARAENRITVRRFDMADAHYVATVPLRGGGAATAVVPPRKARRAGALGPLTGEPEEGEAGELTLVPLLPGESLGVDERVRWERTEQGWQARLGLAYPDRLYHAYFEVALPPLPLAVARGFLLLFLTAAVVGVLVAAGRVVARGPPLRPGILAPLVSSFRARVTLALFAFFLLSVAIFGTLAYRTLAGAAVRTARALAERVAEEGAAWYTEVGGSMELLARRVGADLLEYRDGSLRGGSVDELVALGLYEGWVPPEIHQALTSRRELSATREAEVGGWEYVTAYRRLPDGDVLAAPIPLQAGEVAVGRREVADLLAFAVILGGVLSLALALLVGRTLTRPIQTLRVASERVGGGNLGVRLPEDRTDEFGSVFSAFNRMVSRLRRARRNLVRSSRRSRAIVEEAATGVIALDPSGRVTLVNPRAQQLLGRAVREGEPLAPAGEGGDREVVRWIRRYFRDGLREAGTEVQDGERRIRVRARRISRSGPLGGAVVSLEDVTDELRSERILAWGEMAQQVAHEVKNPLTPMKLSVQHIRRAWEDRRPDFEVILERNVEAVLAEIDRLASIARSFSRFAVPGAGEARPLRPVDPEAVVDEVLALYAGAEGPVRFESALPRGLPRVRAREAELKEALVNLLENARSAIPDRGTVRLEASPEEGEVELRVRDDGVGIPPDVLPRVFEPRFSTRSAGTGLGLAIVRRLVHSWGGEVEIESRPGEGTVVRMRIPAWAPPGATGGGAPGGPVYSVDDGSA